MEAIALALLFLLGGITAMVSLIWQNRRAEARELAGRKRPASLDLDL